MSKNKYRPDIIKDFHLGDALSAIQHNLNKAHETWYKGSDPHTNTMELFRKISALCVAQMEKYGVDKRIE